MNYVKYISHYPKLLKEIFSLHYSELFNFILTVRLTLCYIETIGSRVTIL